MGEDEDDGEGDAFAVAEVALAGVPWWNNARHFPLRLTQIVLLRSRGSFGLNGFTT